MAEAMNANQLRRTWTEFWTARGHTAVPSAGLIPLHPTAPMFTNAGMNQFVPYFLGEEAPPHSRLSSIQKCVRAGGKHNDIDEVGRTTRHVTFFEMLGHFSFGDYFKQEAIAWAWELVTGGYGLDPDHLWVTVHHTDDEAAAIWHEAVGVPAERIQRTGKDNLWEMGETGPCGPCSEIFIDKGPTYGAEGGPVHGSDERYFEFWNTVFMDSLRKPDGSIVPLARRNIDTGVGLERTLVAINALDSVWDTDVLLPLIERGSELTKRRPGPSRSQDPADVSLRIVADHARTVTFLVNDGVLPSNEDRGYVLRRLLRRAVRHAHQLGARRALFPELVKAVIELMSDAYPDLRRNADYICGVVAAEEEGFLRTLRDGGRLLEAELAKGGSRLSGEVAFLLHDTYGYPIDLTREIAAERGVTVDQEAFDVAMAAQRERAREDRRRKGATVESPIGLDDYRRIIESFGPTEFTGYAETTGKGRVLAVLDAGTVGADAGRRIEVFLDRTPFYAEGGGQIGDTGAIEAETGRLAVLDTTTAIPGLTRHVCELVEGNVTPGQEALATVDAARREAIRRNHTGTHLLHWALRELLGPQVHQQGSYVGPDRLRFDFNHNVPLTAEQIHRLEDLVNERVLANEPVRAFETTRAEADSLGAIAFFGEKYGDVVRVVEAGSHSTELCGGTHVPATGTIGPLKIVAEGSIGANLRRVEATTGTATIERVRAAEVVMARAAAVLRAGRPEELAEAAEKLVGRLKRLDEELKGLRSKAALARAAELGAQAAESGGVLVARVDGLDNPALKDLALAVRDRPGVRAVVLGGSPDGERVALAAAVSAGAAADGLHAGELMAGPARVVGGGGGKQRDVATAGGKHADKIDEALDAARAMLGH